VTGLRIGTAGWSIPTSEKERFPGSGSHLERYAHRLGAAEINSTFHRSHRRSTYERWAANVPDHFRFSAKLPKAISHNRELRSFDFLVGQFAQELGPLGHKLSVVLVQFPPSFAFEAEAISGLFAALRGSFDVSLACEPRHASWFDHEADTFLAGYRVARVAADPVLFPRGERPGGWLDLAYYRLHGSPRTYYSAYDRGALCEARRKLLSEDAAPSRWCIFDNTAASAAASNALDLSEMLSRADG
jgi:uncharacterized protein YecE (DUF72 family)